MSSTTEPGTEDISEPVDEIEPAVLDTTEPITITYEPSTQPAFAYLFLLVMALPAFLLVRRLVQRKMFIEMTLTIAVIIFCLIQGMMEINNKSLCWDSEACKAILLDERNSLSTKWSAILNTQIFLWNIFEWQHLLWTFGIMLACCLLIHGLQLSKRSTDHIFHSALISGVVINCQVAKTRGWGLIEMAFFPISISLICNISKGWEVILYKRRRVIKWWALARGIIRFALAGFFFVKEYVGMDRISSLLRPWYGFFLCFLAQCAMDLVEAFEFRGCEEYGDDPPRRTTAGRASSSSEMTVVDARSGRMSASTVRTVQMTD